MKSKRLFSLGTAFLVLFTFNNAYGEITFFNLINESKYEELYRRIEKTELKSINDMRSKDGYTLLGAIIKNAKCEDFSFDYNPYSQCNRLNIKGRNLDAKTDDNVLKTILLLIKKGININEKMLHNIDITPLMIASASGKTDIVKILITNNAKIDMNDRFGRSALSLAVLNRKYYTIKLLTENKAKIDKTSIIAAIHINDSSILQYLIEQGGVLDRSTLAEKLKGYNDFMIETFELSEKSRIVNQKLKTSMINQKIKNITLEKAIKIILDTLDLKNLECKYSGPRKKDSFEKKISVNLDNVNIHLALEQILKPNDLRHVVHSGKVMIFDSENTIESGPLGMYLLYSSKGIDKTNPQDRARPVKEMGNDPNFKKANGVIH